MGDCRFAYATHDVRWNHLCACVCDLLSSLTRLRATTDQRAAKSSACVCVRDREREREAKGIECVARNQSVWHSSLYFPPRPAFPPPQLNSPALLCAAMVFLTQSAHKPLCPLGGVRVNLQTLCSSCTTCCLAGCVCICFVCIRI